MACRKNYRMMNQATEPPQLENQKTDTSVSVTREPVVRLLFGVDSAVPSHDVLQNNLTEFEWVTRNKVYPNFWGRNLTGEDRLTREEIDFLHSQACKIAAIYQDSVEKQTEEQGEFSAQKAAAIALELGIPQGAGIFLEIKEAESISWEYLFGFAEGMLSEGYTPGFRANTDAKFGFDEAFSRGMQVKKEVFGKCLIWAVAPTIKEYDQMTTTHLIHPDNWMPYAPSGTTRKEIAIWQYGKNCHPIEDDMGKATAFHLDLVRNEQIITEKMF